MKFAFHRAGSSPSADDAYFSPEAFPYPPSAKEAKYRDEIYSLQILLSRTQAAPGRTVKKEQEEISPNHVQRINLISV